MRKLFCAALLSLGLASPAFAEDRGNLQIFNDVAKQVNRYEYFTIFDSVHGNVRDGVVTLTGKVTLPYKATDIAKRVAKVNGVTAVRNRIEVLPVSQFDNQLRSRIAHAIYSNPSLSMYGHGVNPSIHVIVERGRVTLDGVVNNDSDRALATFVASGFGTFGLKNELRTRAEITHEMESL